MYWCSSTLLNGVRVSDTDPAVAGSAESEPKRKLDDLIHLAQLCIEVLQQNEEYHAEVSHVTSYAMI